MLDRLILPKFGTWRMDALTSKDVSQWHVQHESTPYQANRALAVFSTLLSWAEKRGMRAGNPCSGVARFPERLVNRYPTPAEIAVLLRASDELAAEGRVTPNFAAGLAVLAMTGARRSEIFAARWDWLDR